MSAVKKLPTSNPHKVEDNKICAAYCNLVDFESRYLDRYKRVLKFKDIENYLYKKTGIKFRVVGCVDENPSIIVKFDSKFQNIRKEFCFVTGEKALRRVSYS